MRSKICLNMIVKNEEARIMRLLESVGPYVDCYAIVDTGSTDRTVRIIEEFFDLRSIHGVIKSVEFKNFEQARNAALDAARSSPYDWDYLLLVDADMELVVADKDWRSKLTAQTYDAIQRAGTLAYDNRRLLSRTAKGQYRGVTHEYLDTGPSERTSLIWFKDHADGSNRKDKFKRDILLLLAGLKAEPNNARYYFYLAQSYRDAGNPKAAITAYRKRTTMGGFDEEVWNARVNLAACLKEIGDEAGFIRELLVAYNQRPNRAEALYDLAKHFRFANQPALSLLFSEPGLRIPYTNDQLFVSDYVYKVGLREEFAICAFYDKSRTKQGFKVCNSLALDKTEYNGARDLARTNLFYYMEPIYKHAPSFQTKQIAFVPPNDLVPLNPSVVNVNNELYTTVRAVNYNIDNDGRYLIRHTVDGSITNDNPIDTRNFLVSLDPNLDPLLVREIKAQLPDPKFALVRGLEDMRLFWWEDDLWCSATIRETNVEGLCEQVRARIDCGDRECRAVNFTRMLPPTRQHEKNWMPWVEGSSLSFAYKANELVDKDGQPLRKHEVSFFVDNLRGSSQVIPFHAGWIALVHEAGTMPGGSKRYYQHRFIWFDYNRTLRSISAPFYFNGKQIEFAVGLARHPDGKRLVISYGVEDKSAWLATIDDHDIWELVHP